MGCTGAHLVHGDDLTSRLLDLLQLAKVVPETRLCDNLPSQPFVSAIQRSSGLHGIVAYLIGRKDTHAVELGRLVRGGRELAPDHLVFDVAAHF